MGLCRLMHRHSIVNFPKRLQTGLTKSPVSVPTTNTTDIKDTIVPDKNQSNKQPPWAQKRRNQGGSGSIEILELSEHHRLARAIRAAFDCGMMTTLYILFCPVRYVILFVRASPVSPSMYGWNNSTTPTQCCWAKRRRRQWLVEMRPLPGSIDDELCGQN